MSLEAQFTWVMLSSHEALLVVLFKISHFWIDFRTDSSLGMCFDLSNEFRKFGEGESVAESGRQTDVVTFRLAHTSDRSHSTST